MDSRSASIHGSPAPLVPARRSADRFHVGVSTRLWDWKNNRGEQAAARRCAKIQPTAAHMGLLVHQSQPEPGAGTAVQCGILRVKLSNSDGPRIGRR
ncbi:hypothetical protein [Kibdelosporangium philippinense]|uniref:hypothetical protein n=1 Tax=Kibdelosporangium philippinense TaxID=211113 RepID=UPI00361A35EB